MSQYIEDVLPPIQSAGLNTQKDITASGSNTFSGSTTFSGTTTLSGSTISITGATTSSTKAFVALSGTSAGVTGGLQAPPLSFGNTTIPLGIYAGSGVPTIAAYQGSLYLNVTADAGFNERLYVRTTTTWVGFQKAAAS